MPKRKSERHASKRISIIRIVAFVVLFFASLFISSFIDAKLVGTITRMQAMIKVKYYAIGWAFFWWLIIGGENFLGQTVASFCDKLFLGPFNWIRVESLCRKQLKVIWIGSLAIIYLIVFPPWIAYEFSSSGKGTGPTTFADFHFFGASQYSVLGESVYSVAEISRIMQLVMILIVIALSLLLFFYYGSSDQRGKA